MKILKETYESRAYTEEEAKEAIIKFKDEAASKGYTVSAAGYTYKAKKKKGEVVSDGWLVKCVAIFDDFWGLEDEEA